MTSEITFNIDTGLNQRFQMALQLNEEHADQVIEAMLKSYIARTFSQAAASYTDNSSPKLTPPNDTNYAKAIHRIPKWANKPTQINHKIIRAYLQLAEMGEVTYNQLARQCTNHEDHPDVYVPTFSSNFAQMKFDGDKSHGKVFDVAPDGHASQPETNRQLIPQLSSHLPGRLTTGPALTPGATSSRFPGARRAH